MRKAFCDSLLETAEKDESVILITNDLGFSVREILQKRGQLWRILLYRKTLHICVLGKEMILWCMRRHLILRLERQFFCRMGAILAFSQRGIFYGMREKLQRFSAKLG